MLRYKTILLLLIVGLTLGTNPVRAQQLQASLSHYSTDDGLTSNAISHILQDDLGYLWISTWNGLSRFDGYHFYNYATGAKSRIPRLHNRIHEIVIDSNQNVWMRMYDGRVFVVKRNIDKIVNPFEGIAGNENFRSNYPVTVTSIGQVLINVEGIGLYKVKPERDGFSTELIHTGGLSVTSMAEGYQNDIWLGTDKGVHRLDASNLTIERKGLFLEERITCLYSNGYNIFAGTQSGKIVSFSYGQEPMVVRSGGDPVMAIFVDSYGLIWFSDSRLGVVSLNPETGKEKLYTQRIVVPDLDGFSGAFYEADGILWVRLNRGGFGYYNRETDEVEYFHNDPSNPWNLSNTVNAVLPTHEGVVWESTSRRGLEKLEIMKKVIVRHRLHQDGLATGNDIRALLYDQEHGLLMVGNKGSELFIMKGDSVPTAVITHDSKGKPLGRIYGLMKDSKGKYWVSTKGNGLFCMIREGAGKYHIENYCHSDDNPWTLNSDNVYTTVEDKAGNLWVATYGGGVNILTRNKSGMLVALHADNAMKNYPKDSYKKVRTLAIDREGKVWAGTTDGILIMGYADGKISIDKLQPSDEDPEHILLSNDIMCLACDARGDMWVGTNGGGLGHAYAKDKEGKWLFEHFDSHDGLSGDEIRSLTFDSRYNVWIASDHKLCSFDASQRIFTTFANQEGVDETSCSEGAAIVLPGDDILFGTQNGYYEVERSKLTASAGNILKLRITDFFLNDELQSPRFNDNFDYYVPESREVRLPDHGDRFVFRFASLNYQLQHRVHYQYMLEGYDQSWRNADKRRTASYAGVPVGRYRFMVKAFLLESPERYDLKEIVVEVPPYFLLTTNAIWLYMPIVALLAIGLMFYRQRQLARRENQGTAHEETGKFNYANEADVAFMQRQQEFMEVHVSDPMLTPEELAEVSGLTEEEYVRQLYQITKLSPREFINDYRLTKALQMLRDSDATIAEIVFRCGYADVSAFNRHVKAKIGMLPSQYRDQYRKETATEQPAETVVEAEVIE